MKTIKEKAEEYAYTNWQSDDYHEGAEFDAIGHTEKTFQAGANYVLEQIEEVTNICFDEELKRVIKQLKK